MGKQFRAAIVGGSGYGGGEIARRLLCHPEVELVRVASVDHIGEPISSVHQNLAGCTDLKFEQLSMQEVARDVDVVLLGLPHTVSAKMAPELLATGVKVVDLSGDFRLRDAEVYQRAYHATHPHPELLRDGSFVYGLPELNAAAIRTARAVASPGCFATAIELALLPLAKQGLLAGELHTVGITGSSGSGIKPQAGTHHPTRAVNLKAYKPLSHQHVPEIEQTLRDAGAAELSIRFVPISAPLSRGILASVFVELQNAPSHDELLALYRAQYKEAPFVRVPEGRLPEVAAVAGSNYAEVSLSVAELGDGKRLLTAFCALDNLIKGGAGQGVQSMNLMLGLDQRLSLQDPGGYP